MVDKYPQPIGSMGKIKNSTLLINIHMTPGLRPMYYYMDHIIHESEAWCSLNINDVQFCSQIKALCSLIFI